MRLRKLLAVFQNLVILPTILSVSTISTFQQYRQLNNYLLYYTTTIYYTNGG